MPASAPRRSAQRHPSFGSRAPVTRGSYPAGTLLNVAAGRRADVRAGPGRAASARSRAGFGGRPAAPPGEERGWADERGGQAVCGRGGGTANSTSARLPAMWRRRSPRRCKSEAEVALVGGGRAAGGRAVRDRPWRGRRLHMIGVGGAGMSGYARAADALGATVTGSDREETPYLRRLREEGVLEASIGHHAANVPAGEDVEVYHSSAIAPDNPERVAAGDRGLPDRPRADLLAELSAMRRTIAVAGAHGKTTTAAMVVQILRSAALDPGWLIGASLGGALITRTGPTALAGGRGRRV